MHCLYSEGEAFAVLALVDVEACQLADAVESYGPLDRKTCELIKIGISVGAGLETATRSHVRRAMQHGATEPEIEQAVLLAYNTCGFPRMVMGWQWARQQIARGV